ncbi:PREDICTED: oxysterol-binding protein-related protein 5-like [Leptosomus discolor]|uniref:oxysterol-binding protein-related protein 5-like n=1 Tax=Leptosomus discolor TaxID=188344 RepID=UPI000522D8C0|nr:PREDICTED: oxysterol-binding protein-related protein 5-like [Leptosomus discolor]
MPLATMGTWGLLEPGRMFAGWFFWAIELAGGRVAKTPTAHAMKEENFLRRRFSLCPASSTPQKVDPRKLTRNLFFGADNDIYPLSLGKDVEGNSPSALKDETPQTPNSISKIEYKLCNGSDKECVSPTAKFTKKETLKVQKKNYRQEKKRATKQLFSALKDPSVVITADWLKIRGTLKSWTKLWCVLKPGVLLIYKTPKIGQWVGTILLHSCELIERPSKKDGFCFKLFHPLDQSIWAVKGPKGENVGSITQPLPSSYLIFRAASESDGSQAGSREIIKVSEKKIAFSKPVTVYALQIYADEWLRISSLNLSRASCPDNSGAAPEISELIPQTS